MSPNDGVDTLQRLSEEPGNEHYSGDLLTATAQPTTFDDSKTLRPRIIAKPFDP